MKENWPLLVFLILIFGSCREDITFDLESEFQPAVSVNSSIAPDRPIEIIVLKNSSLAASSNFDPMVDAQIWMEGHRIPGGRTKLVFNPAESKYKFPLDAFRVSEDKEYNMTLIANGFDTVSSQTIVPMPSNFRRIETISKKKTALDVNRASYEIELAIEIKDPNKRPAYYQLIPSRTLTEYRVSPSNDTIATDYKQLLSMKIVDIENNRNAVSQLIHQEGVFIDESKLNDPRIILKIETETPVLTYKEIFSKLHLELRTITPELFFYNQYLHSQTISSKTDYTFPVKSYSNVRNGFGVFGSYSNRTISIAL